MGSKIKLKALFFIGFYCFLSPTLSSNLAKEKRWADHIIDSIVVGRAEWLKVQGNNLLAIYTPHATEQAKGAAIVLHGRGVHPNWDQVIRPIRSQLPEYGWATLSVQLPILENGADNKKYIPLYDEVTPRLQTAIKFLKRKGINNIVIIAHSLGASMAAYYLATKADPTIKAFVAIGASATLYNDKKIDYIQSLKSISLPILDLYGSNDLDNVLKSDKARIMAARKSGNKHYIQIKVAGANHFFDNKEDTLIKRIRGWITKNAPGTELKIK